MKNCNGRTGLKILESNVNRVVRVKKIVVVRRR
jgi:hypothetical protein